MSKDKRKYLSAYVPDGKPKEDAKRGNPKGSDRLDEIEEAIRALNDLLAKQTRDALDSLYNLDMDNMSSSMRRLFQSYEDGIRQAQAEIKTWADTAEAGFSALAQWQNETNLSIAGLTETANEHRAALELLAQWQKTVEDGTISSIAALNLKADENAASIQSITSWKSTVEDDIEDFAETLAVIEQVADENGASISQIVQAVGRNGEVSAASIVAAVNRAGSSVKISADHVEIDGFVTFSSLEEDGMSVINGNNISLVSDAWGDSISRLTFYKYRYTNRDQTADDNALEAMFRIQTVDNERDDENYARYAVQFQTMQARENSAYYSVAMKFLSAGAMSLESEGAMYMYASTYCTMEARANMRLRARNDHYTATTSYWGTAAASNDYIFCTDGIYYGGKLLIST